jgi:hypothetical protein
VGYLNGSTGGFGASYIFMAGSLALSALVTIIAVNQPGNTAAATDESNVLTSYTVSPQS